MGTILAIGISATKNQTNPKKDIEERCLILYMKIPIAINIRMDTSVLG